MNQTTMPSKTANKPKTLIWRRLVLCTILMVGLSACNRKETIIPLVSLSPSGTSVVGQDFSSNLKNKGAKYTSDRYGQPENAFYFDGSAASMHIKLNGIPSINSPITISWWYKIQAEPIFKDAMDAGNMIALVDTTQAIGIQAGYRGPGYNTKGLDIWNWGGNTLIECPTPKIDQWHHCVYVFDGNEHRFYLDGNQISKSKAPTQSGRPNLLMLGNYPGGTQFFKGSLDDINIYDKALTVNQVLDLFTTERP